MITVKNHRRKRRIPYLGPVRISWEDRGQARFAAGRCIDISEEGMRIEVSQPVQAGSMVQICADRIRVSGAATVKRMERCGSKYLLGLQLTQAALRKAVAELEGTPLAVVQ
jgi:hypothetical protein